MARIHYWQYIVDEEGRPLEGVNVLFYLNDNPTQEADIFTHPALGASTYTSSAGIKTDGNGFFEFWIGDEFETLAGYSAVQKFRLTWERAGILIGSINNIDIFPPLFQVDETDGTSSTKNEKNKTVSNNLAYTWSNHVDSTYASTVPPHDILPVVETSQDAAINKLVSNSLMNYILSAIASAGTLSIESTAAIERNFTISSWSASGSNYYANINHFIGREYPIVQLRFTDTKTVYKPIRIASTSANSLRILVSENNSTEITVIG
jgi:hypothetical protein